MQRADVVLSLISNSSRKFDNYSFDRLYRNLFNKDFYNELLNLDNIKYNDYDERIETLITELRSETFYPKKDCEIFLLVERCVSKLLEAVYSNEFADSNEKFRPCSNLYNALQGEKRIKEARYGI